jgi:hypothetical protein
LRSSAWAERAKRVPSRRMAAIGEVRMDVILHNVGSIG